MSLFESNLRKQIRKLPKFLKSVKTIHYYSLLFIRVLTQAASLCAGSGYVLARPRTGPEFAAVKALLNGLGCADSSTCGGYPWIDLNDKVQCEDLYL